MPCIYAHDSFGHKVARQLPKELQTIIKKYPKEFQAGLQGPDFLFFYHPMLRLRTNQMGYWQHGQTMADFIHSLLPSLRKRGTDQGSYVYLLGYICHFVLDSECHTFVIPEAEKPGYSHLTIENEFDRYLLQKDGYIPVTYPVWHKIAWTPEIVDAIYRIYRPLKLGKKKIRRALRGMRFYKKILTCGYSLKRVFIRMLMKLSFHYDKLEGHMMTLKPKKYAGKTNARLQTIYQEAISLASELLQDFHLTVTAGKPLHERFYCTFKNNQILPHS